VLVLAPGLPGGAEAQQQAPTPAAVPGSAPDRCEENDTLIQPCAIPTETDVDDLTFVDDAIDVFSVLLKAGRTYSVRATSAGGIDPRLALFQAPDIERPLADNDDVGYGSGDAAVELTTSSEGWYLVRVENRAPGDMRGRTYSLSVRSVAPPASSATAPALSAAPGDLYENNYDLTHAARLVWGVPYDLSLVCPERRADACPAGDHDFFLVPVKRGAPLIALTYDLGPGTDTTLALYVPESGARDPSTGLVGWRMVQGNDDVIPDGAALRSQVLLTSTWDGEALLIVAASGRRDSPELPEAAGPPGRYRLIVGSPALPAVQQVLQAQAAAQAPSDGATAAPATGEALPTPAASRAAPAPTVVATAVVGPGADAEQIIRESCITGLARVANAQGARFSAAAVPIGDQRILMIYPRGSSVQLLGECYLGWVKVLPQQSVTPGWMFAPDLQLVEAEQAADPTAAAGPLTATIAVAPGEENAADPPALPRVGALPDRPLVTPTAAPHVAFTVEARIVDQNGLPRSRVRVQLADVLGAALREADTDAAGRVTLTADLPDSTVAWLRIPAAAIELPLTASDAQLTFTIPSE
jgi:hypothetical protein